MSKDTIGNLKPAPFALSGSVVRATLGFGSSPRTVLVPVRDAFTLGATDDLHARPKAWCGQCEARRTVEEVSNCASRFCKLRPQEAESATSWAPPTKETVREPVWIGLDKGAEPEPVEPDLLDWPDAPLPDVEPETITAGSGAKAACAVQNLKDERSDALPQESAPAVSSAGCSPRAGSNPAPANLFSHLPSPLATRRIQLERATAFLKAMGILVQIVDRNAMVRRYRVSGKRDWMLLEQVVEYAVALGMPEEAGQ